MEWAAKVLLLPPTLTSRSLPIPWVWPGQREIPGHLPGMFLPTSYLDSRFPGACAGLAVAVSPCQTAAGRGGDGNPYGHGCSWYGPHCGDRVLESARIRVKARYVRALNIPSTSAPQSAEDDVRYAHVPEGGLAHAAERAPAQ